MSRKSTHTRAQPQNFADEQASNTYDAQDLLNLRRTIQQSIAPEVDAESDEEEVTVEDAPSSEEEVEEKENMPPQSAWNEHTHGPPPPHFTEQCGSNLPRHRTMTELGYLRCFLPDSLIATIATNTTLYAASKEAAAGWATTSEEVWSFISVYIFMGIVSLPSFPHVVGAGMEAAVRRQRLLS